MPFLCKCYISLLSHVVLRVRRQKEKQWNTLIVVVLLTNAISIFDILNSNETQNSSGEAVSAIHKMFKIMLKSRCLQKSKIVDWRLRLGGKLAVCGAQAILLLRFCFY